MTPRPALVLQADRLFAARGVVVAEQVDLSAAAGSVVAVEGGNGAGKSTVLAAAAGLLPSGAGSLRPSTVGFAPERTEVLPRLSVRRWLTGLARTAGLARAAATAQVDQVIDGLGLSAVQHRTMRELSRGNVQRVLVAQALLGPPSLLVLDEPGGGLDADGVRRVSAAVSSAAAGGAVVLVARHAAAPVPLPPGKTWLVDEGRLHVRDRDYEPPTPLALVRVETDDGAAVEVPADEVQPAVAYGLGVLTPNPYATSGAGGAGDAGGGDRAGAVAKVLQGARHRARLLSVSQRQAAPALLFLVLLGFVYATDAGRPVTAAALTAAVLAPVLTWVTVLAHVVDGRLVGRAFAAHVGGVGRAHLAADLATVPFLVAATAAACVWPWLSQHGQPHPAAVLAQMALMHLGAGLLGLGIGTLVVPPLVSRAGWRVLTATGLYLVLLLVPVSPLRPLLELAVGASGGAGQTVVAAAVAGSVGLALAAATAYAARSRS